MHVKCYTDFLAQRTNEGELVGGGGMSVKWGNTRVVSLISIP